MAKAFHAVVRGLKPGIYREWFGPHGAQIQVEGFPNKLHEGFDSLEAAVSWYLRRAGTQPFDRQWYECHAQDIPAQEIEMRPITPDLAISITIATSGSSSSAQDQPVSDQRLAIDTQEIGRWGERFALWALLKWLDERHPEYADANLSETKDGYTVRQGERTLAGIHWYNNEGESNQSPDIKVVEDGYETYWEVKSTIHHDKMAFALTASEWGLAKEKGEQFYILRVCGAGTRRATIYMIQDPYRLAHEGLIRFKEQSSLPRSVTLMDPSHLEDVDTAPVRQSNKDPSHLHGYVEGIGRRKASTARVRLRPNGTGSILVNGRPDKAYFRRMGDLDTVKAPLHLVGYQGQMDVTILVKGGGVTGQAEASRLGIARALLKLDPELRQELRRAGFLTRDARVKERKKPGLRRARKAPQYTKR